MSLNKLYTIVELNSDAGIISATISIDPAHEIFAGHFPGAPVMPGVVQLQIVKEILGKQLGRNLRMKAMKTCKFLNIINPKETPEIMISIKYTESEVIDVVASGSSSDTTYFKAQVSYI